MSNRSPAFQFYPADWLSSAKVLRMTPAERGGYINLLAYQWLDQDCSLPDSDEELAVLSGLGELWFKGSASNLRSCFKTSSTTPPRIANKRLRAEKDKQAKWRKKCSMGGRKSAGKRCLQKQVPFNNPSTNLEGKGYSSSSSSSPSSSSKTDGPELELEGEQPPKKPKSHPLTAFGVWVDVHAELGMQKPAAIPHDTTAAQRIVAALEGDMEKFKAVCRAYLQDDAAWGADKGFPLWAMEKDVAKYASPRKPSTPAEIAAHNEAVFRERTAKRERERAAKRERERAEQAKRFEGVPV